jgi:catechol 2,3-dioxygenase-like lactoylglutathione lyase family enzyme
MNDTTQPRLLSHIDLRVRDRNAANAFYTKLFEAIGTTGMNIGEHFTTFYYDDGREDTYTQEWFGFTEDAEVVPGSARIALYVGSRDAVDRVGATLASIGAQSIEGPEDIYGYYAVFFTDPDGNKLEVCCTTSDPMSAE